MHKGIIVFDFDDTLVSTNPLFDRAKNMFSELMHTIGLYHKNVLEIVNRFDIALVKEYGYFAKPCFPTALVKTYEYFCKLHKRIPDEAIKKKAFEIGMWVFEQQPEILEGAHETLKKLNTMHNLILLTKGEEEHQKEKILASGLAHYFKETLVVPDKDVEIFAKIVTRHGGEVDKSWSVGNSIKADINPALQVGMNTIWVKGPTWDFEIEEPLKIIHEVHKLSEIPPIIMK